MGFVRTIDADERGDQPDQRNPGSSLVQLLGSNLDEISESRVRRQIVRTRLRERLEQLSQFRGRIGGDLELAAPERDRPHVEAVDPTVHRDPIRHRHLRVERRPEDGVHSERCDLHRPTHLPAQQSDGGIRGMSAPSRGRTTAL